MKKIILVALCLFTAGLTWLCAQAQSGTLTGQVISANGGPVANAAVTVTNQDTHAAQRVLTSPDGRFTVTNLAPGNYQVSVEAQGFALTTAQGVVLTAGPPVNINLNLTGGGPNKSVQIRGVATPQDNNAEFSMGLERRRVQELPVIDRNHQQLAGLQTGVTPPIPALPIGLDPPRNRFYSTDGQAPYLNQYYSEGVINQEPVRGTAIRVIPEEAIASMNVTTANPTKEKGFTGGALVANTLQSGTNGFHGSLFENWSGNLLRTRNFFDTVDTDAPRFTYNQFGVTAGGALQPDHTFLFGSYEGNYQRGDQTQLLTVPTPAALTGNFSGIPGLTLYSPTTGNALGVGRFPVAGNMVSPNLINPASAAIARFLPSPNLPGFANNYVSNTPFQNDYQKADARLDHRFGDTTNLFLRYGYSNDHAIDPSPLGNVIGNGLRDRLIAQNAALGVTANLHPGLDTELRFGYNRYDQKVNSSAVGFGNGAGFVNGLGSGSALASINIPGLPLIGAAPFVPEHPIDNTFNLVWTTNYVTSIHHFQFGVDVRRLHSDGFLDSAQNLFGANGSFFFGPGATLNNNGVALSPYSEFYNSFAAFLQGAPSQFGASNFLVSPSYRQWQPAIWVGHRLQFFHRITVDLGVRYEVYSPIEPAHSGGAAFFNSAGNTLSYAGIGGTGLHSYRYDLNNVMPRIGIAIRGDEKTVFRVGYGMQYFEPPFMYSGAMAPMVGSVTGVQGTYGVATVPGGFTGSLTAPTTATLANGTAAGNLPVTFGPLNFQTPYIQTVNAQVERQFLYGTVLSLGYVGTFGRHLSDISELNAALPGTGVAGLPLAGVGRTGSALFYNNDLTNNYNSLHVSLTRRFAQGISFTGSYTFSKALGYTNSNGVLLDPYNLRANYGPADYDRQHVLTIAHLWELPFGTHGNSIAGTLLGGWQLNGIFTWATGTPLTLTADPVLCACPGNTVLASTVGGVSTSTNYGNGGSLILGNFVSPVGSTAGDLGRGAIRGPGFKTYDMSLFKNFHVHDRFTLQLRGEAYNLTNSPRLINPVTNINAPNFGEVTSTVNGAFGRQVNLGLRIVF